MDSDKMMNRLRWLRVEVDRAQRQAREVEAEAGAEPQYLTEGIAGYRDAAAVACRKARIAGDEPALRAGLGNLIRANEAALAWWNYALRRAISEREGRRT